MNKEIIAAIDGSLYSDHALAYMADLFAADETVTIHLVSWITSATSVMPSMAGARDSLIPANKLNKKEILAKRYLHKAKDKLLKAGLQEKQINTSVQASGYNIAGTIQHHLTKAIPDALIIGRRGFKGITEMLMGSVSADLFRKCHSSPLWIIDGEIKHKDFFVPLDGTVKSLLATDHLAHMVNGRKDLRIYLFHCTTLFRKKTVCDPKLFYKHWDKEWCDQYLSGTDCLFHAPRQILLEAGIPDTNITILPEKTEFEEAHGIISEAKKQKCGTIVMGRRSARMAKGLFGGVSDRTVKRVENLAIWVVS